MPPCYVYILASWSRALYHGFTRDLGTRVRRHRQHAGARHTRKYPINRLVYFEIFPDARSALVRERQLKRWPRARKIRLIERHNPDWRDLSLDL